MAIEILTGVPGAGKSYFAVYRIHKQLKDSDARCLILHNIDGLRLQDNRAISVEWKTEDFRANDMADRLRSYRSEYGLQPEDIIHIYIDEAQRFFPPELKNTDILYFFDYHRHMGVNVTLITQHEKKLTFKITTLAEVEIRAVNARINPFGSSFVYKLSSGGEQYSTQRLPKDKQVFALYTSFQAGTGKSTKSRLRYVVLAIVIAAPIAWIIFFHFFARSFGLTGDDAPPSHNATPPTIQQIEKRPLLSSKPDSPPVPLPPAPPVSDTTEEEKPETLYLGPEIKEYSTSRDAVLIQVHESGLDAWMPVTQFLAEYPPTLYGYGYFHAPGRRWVMMNAANQQTIFPVKNSVYVRTFVKSEPEPTPTPEPPEYPLAYLDMTERPDQHGYTRSDYERVFMRQRGFKYIPAQSAAAPTQPGEGMQPGATAGAANATVTPKSNRG